MERASLVSRARNILRFRAFASFSSSSFFFVTLYASCPLRSTPAESPLLFLTNLHILPLACAVAHTSHPRPFSSLSHLHPLVPFVGESILSIPSSIYSSAGGPAYFHGSFNFTTHLSSFLSFAFFRPLSFSLSSLSLRLLAVKSET